MVNPPPPSSSSPDPIMRQLNQKLKGMEAETLTQSRAQEAALRFSTNQFQQARRRNEELRILNRNDKLLAAKVQAKLQAIGVLGLPESKPEEKQTSSVPAINNIKNRRKKASSQSSSDPKETSAAIVAAKPMPMPPVVVVVEAPKELPPIPQLDLGCRFVPTDQELIVCLLKKMAGEALPKFIIERDLYATEEPKHLFRNNPTAAEMYFFTPIKIKFDSGKRADRIVGSGTWKLQNNRDVFDDPTAKKNVIGCKRTLNFIETQPKGKSDSWIMHEYITKEKDQGRWAICRVKRGRGNFVGFSAAPSLAETSPTRWPPQDSDKNNTDDSLELDLKL